MPTPIPQQDAGHLYQPQVVGGLLLVTHQYASAFRKPAQRPLHHPTPRRVTPPAGLVELLLSDAPDVGGVASLLHEVPGRAVVVALVQAKVLGRLLRGLGTLGHHGVERGLQELVVAHVRRGDHHRKRPAVGLDQEGTLHPVFPAVGGVGTDEIPPKRALPIAPSAACHSQLTPPSSSHSSTSAAQTRSSNPSSTHRWKARCTVESSRNSSGIRFHWQPVLSRKMTASSTARRSARGRPVVFGGSCSARMGSIFSHSLSGTRQMVGMGLSSGERSVIGASSRWGCRRSYLTTKVLR